MALTRPEGALLALFMLAAILVFTGVRDGTRILVAFVALVGVLGLAYFVWRWTYFGSPLPNPYYKKGGGTLHLNGLRKSLEATGGMLLPFVPLYVLALRTRAGRREAAFSLIPIALFTLIWVLVSDVTNYAGRFQYAVLVIAALSWPALFPGSERELVPVRAFVGVWLVLAVVGLSAYRVETLGDVPAHDGRVDVGRALRPYASKGYTLATTEAGGLPLYSRWRAVDTWGLNDRWIAHHGRVTPAYLDRYGPELIVIHGFFSPAARDPRCTCASWNRMTLAVRSYAESHHYLLVAAFGTGPRHGGVLRSLRLPGRSGRSGGDPVGPVRKGRARRPGRCAPKRMPAPNDPLLGRCLERSSGSRSHDLDLLRPPAARDRERGDRSRGRRPRRRRRRAGIIPSTNARPVP